MCWTRCAIPQLGIQRGTWSTTCLRFGPWRPGISYVPLSRDYHLGSGAGRVISTQHGLALGGYALRSGEVAISPSPPSPADDHSSAADPQSSVPSSDAAVIEELRKNARLFVRRPKSIAHRELAEIAVALQRMVMAGLRGDAGRRRMTFITNLTPKAAHDLFLHASRAGLCASKLTKKALTITFSCLNNLLAVLDRDSTFFSQFG